MHGSADSRVQELQERLDAIGWGLLFLFFAALALPSGTTEYAAVAILGGLMLALNAVRIALDVSVRWFAVVLGASMLVGGGAALQGVKLDLVILFFLFAGLIAIASAFRPSAHRSPEAPGRLA